MTRRRELLLWFVLAGLPHPTFAQAGKVWRLGILSIRARPLALEGDVQYGAFLQGLRDLGYIDGKNLAIEWRFAHGNYDLLPSLAADLVRLNVDVIAAVNVPVIRAAKQATKTIPIVMLTSSDPVGSGFVASLAHPGGNITGLSNINVDLSAKYLELLEALVPRLARVGFLMNPANPNHGISLTNIEKAAAKARVRVLPLSGNQPADIDRAFGTAAKEKIDGLIVAIDSRFTEMREQIVQLTRKQRLPSIFPNRPFVEIGGLMSYGQDFSDTYRRAAAYVDKLFKGAKPSDLPVETASTLQLIINRTTARELGLTVPAEMLLRADAVID